MAEGTQPRPVDVLIIGGGWTGVSAALKLKELQCTDFHLVEANTRLGGRVFSYEYRPTPVSKPYVFEHGAQYIGVMQPNIMALVKQYMPEALVDGVKAYSVSPDQIERIAQKIYRYDRYECLFGIGGVPSDLGLWDMLGVLLMVKQIEAMEQTIHVAEPWKSAEEVKQLDKYTFSEWLASQDWLSPTARDLLVVSVQCVLSVEPKEISAFYFLWYCACNNGYLNVINDLEGGPQQYYRTHIMKPH